MIRDWTLSRHGYATRKMAVEDQPAETPLPHEPDPIENDEMIQRPDDAILWYEGMLLLPQHFQQQDRRLNQLLYYHAATLDPYHWGVLDLEIDEDSLAKDLFRVAELSAVMPDALVVARGTGDEELQISLAEPKAAAQRLVVVHVTVPSRSISREAADKSEIESRFRQLEGEPVIDLSTGEGAVAIQRLRPTLQLKLGVAPSTAEHTSFPLARLCFDGARYTLDHDWVPPVLRVARDSPVGQICGRIEANLRIKAEQLWQLESATTGRASQRLDARLRVASLLAGVPALDKLLTTDVAHPFMLYRSLCALAGPLSMLRQEMPLPPELPPYRHDDLLATFRGARQAIEAVIAESVGESYDPYRFVLTDGRFDLQESFRADWQERQLLLGISRGRATEREIEAWLENAHIGAHHVIDELRGNRDPGVGRRRLEPGEADLVPARDVTLFELERHSPYTVPDQILTVLNPSDATLPREIVLYVRNSDGEPVR